MLDKFWFSAIVPITNCESGSLGVLKSAQIPVFSLFVAKKRARVAQNNSLSRLTPPAFPDAVNPHLRTVLLLAARCSGLRTALAFGERCSGTTDALWACSTGMVVPHRSQARLRLSYLSASRLCYSHFFDRRLGGDLFAVPFFSPLLSPIFTSFPLNFFICRLSSAWSLRIVRALLGTPCFTGLIDSHWPLAAPSFRPSLGLPALLRPLRLVRPSRAPAASRPPIAHCASLRCARHFSPSGSDHSQTHSRLSLPYWAYFALLTSHCMRFRAPLGRLSADSSPCEGSAMKSAISCINQTLVVPKRDMFAENYWENREYKIDEQRKPLDGVPPCGAAAKSPWAQGELA